MTGQRLREWREALGWTQAQAYAWYMGQVPLSAQPDADAATRKAMARTWRRWERGERGVPAPLVRSIEEYTPRRRRREKARA